VAAAVGAKLGYCLGPHPVGPVDLQARQMGEVLERIAEPHQHTRASGGSMHVQIVIVRRDPVHGAADFRVDLAQERRQVFFRFGWLNVTLPHAPIRRVMSCVGAEHDDAEAHEQDNKDIRPQRHRKRAIMLKCQMIEPRDRHTEDRRHQGARVERDDGCAARAASADLLAPMIPPQ